VTLYQPVWLLLAVPLAASLWLWRFPSRLLLSLRVATLLLVLLALCGLAVLVPGRAGTVVVVADRSLSMPPDSEGAELEAIGLLQKSMADADRLGVVAFGRTAVVERPPQPGTFAKFVHDVGGDASNLAEALETALALIPRDAPGRVFVISDGRWTGRDPAAAAALAAARGVAVDYRHEQRPTTGDLAIARLDAPSSVGPGEAFLITAWVQAPVGQEVSFELRRGAEVLAAGKRQVSSGLSRLTFRDRAAGPGTQAYSLTVTGAGDDPVPENNRARLLVGVQGPRPVLLVTADPDQSGLARLLRAGKVPVRAVPAEARSWSLEELSKYSAVLLENVPAERIGSRGMDTLAAWVRSAGGGLMMTGGRSSYGPGGYYHSPLEPVLPVSMELRKEHRKMTLAIVVALDRSGSMAMPVGGGRVKMDLANLGTVQVLDLLGPQDEFGCLAVDTVPHVIHELGVVENKGPVRDRILGIQSMGGGIYVYEALEAAHAILRTAKAQTKHIILFADAADAEEPKAYQTLVEQCRKDDMTVSVIGLGKETDKDGELLKDIARRGNGRCFFSDQPDDLPRLFAQDTFVVARSTFLDEVTPVKATAGLTALAGRPFALSRPVGGYNLCYLRPGANLAAVTLDEYKAPLVAAWQAGSGRVLCYTGEADGRHTGPIAGWKDVGEFFTSLARWTAGPTGELPGNMVLTQDVKNGAALVRLHLDPGRKAEPFTGLPGVTVLRATSGRKPRAEQVGLHWDGADTLAAEVPLQGDETVVAAVDVPGHGTVALPPACLPYSPEFRPAEPGTGLAALERLARATGGKERVELPSIWADFPRLPRLVEVGRWLLLAAVVVLLLEVLERRTGLLSQALGRAFRRRARAPAAPAEKVRALPWLKRRPGRKPAAPPPKPAGRPTGSAAPAPTAEPPLSPEVEPPKPTPTAEPEGGGGLLDALRQARRRARGG
jgi:Mg-chelatase subunit ChlD